MSEYKIDSDIPLPIPSLTTCQEDLEEPERELSYEETRWTPFKPNQRKCKPGKHSPEVGRCTLCGDVFPCPSGNCGHFDCADPKLLGFDCPGNGTALPEEFSCDEASCFMARGENGTVSIGLGEFAPDTAAFSAPSESSET